MTNSTKNKNDYQYNNAECTLTVKITDKSDLASFLIDILDITIYDNDDNTNDDTHNENDVEDLINNTPELNSNPSFNALWGLLKDLDKMTVLIEPNYIDKVYRDSYYMYYAAKHFGFSRYCSRLFIFNGLLEENVYNIPLESLNKLFIGCVVIRPLLNMKIGRTLINPAYFARLRNVYIRCAEYEVNMRGIKLHVNAFPFSMQDGETTSCAEITIINLLDYYTRKYDEYKKFMPSDIVKIAVKNGYERGLPTKGLNYSVMSKVFMEAGFSPVLYNSTHLETTSKFKRIFHYYIESGIPLAMGVDAGQNTKHSFVCIGHGNVNISKLRNKLYSVSNPRKNNIWFIDSADLVEDYIVVDDNISPYTTYKWHEENGITFFDRFIPEYLLVPMNKRMLLEADDAYEICTAILSAEDGLGIKNHIQNIGTKESPVVTRFFLAASKSFRGYRINYYSQLNRELRDEYIKLSLPRFIWVCELFRAEDYEQQRCIGEIILDATAFKENVEECRILVNYQNKLILPSIPVKTEGLYRDSADDTGRKVLELRCWEKFPSYRGNLQQPQPNRAPTS